MPRCNNFSEIDLLRFLAQIFVSPVVRTFIYERTRDETLEWVESICKWNFKQIIPAHLDAPIRAGPKQFKEAFKFLSDPAENPLPQVQSRTRSPFSSSLERVILLRSNEPGVSSCHVSSVWLHAHHFSNSKSRTVANSRFSDAYLFPPRAT